jgi:hypothetical protein
MEWARMLAYVTGTVDQELLARNEYLASENRILKAQLKGRLKLSDAERRALGEIGHRLGRRVLTDVATVARPDTILGWYRKLVARKFDGSKAARAAGAQPEPECLRGALGQVGQGGVPVFPRNTDRHREGQVRCRERLGGLLRYYHREAA